MARMCSFSVSVLLFFCLKHFPSLNAQHQPQMPQKDGEINIILQQQYFLIRHRVAIWSSESAAPGFLTSKFMNPRIQQAFLIKCVQFSRSFPIFLSDPKKTYSPKNRATLGRGPVMSP